MFSGYLQQLLYRTVSKASTLILLSSITGPGRIPKLEELVPPSNNEEGKSFEK